VAAALVGLALVLRRDRVAFFWLALSLGTYGVVSNIVVPIGTIFGERLLYLPSAGFCVLVAMALAHARRGWVRGAASALAVALVAGWGVRTAFRNPVWHDNLRLAEATVASAPDSTLAHYHLGTTFWELGREQEALDELARALAIDPGHVDAIYNTGVIHMLRERPDEALHFFRRVIDLDPRHFASWVNTAAIDNARGDFRAGLDAAEHAVAIRPDAPNGWVMKGVALRFLGRLGEARTSFQMALRLPQPPPAALLGLGATALEQGDFAMATRAFEELARAAPSPEAYRGLVASYRAARATRPGRRPPPASAFQTSPPLRRDTEEAGRAQLGSHGPLQNCITVPSGRRNASVCCAVGALGGAEPSAPCASFSNAGAVFVSGGVPESQRVRVGLSPGPGQSASVVQDAPGSSPPGTLQREPHFCQSISTNAEPS
jgi:tetratricopeptide (TPR) repeat protein